MEYKKTNILRLANTVFNKIQKKKLLYSQDHLLITFSGGQDSALCLLVLFILKKRKKFTWNRKKLLDFSKQYKIKGTLIKHKYAYLQKRSFCKYAYKSEVFVCNEYNFVCPFFCKWPFLSLPCLHIVIHPYTGRLPFTPQYFLQKKKKNNLLFQDKKIAYNHLTNLFITDYTLLWCNHFWQKQSFFTMEHVSKLIFCKGYAIHFFTPVKIVLSEQDARNWRHKVMQRSSFFIRPKKFCYNSIELFLNFVSIPDYTISIQHNRDNAKTRADKIHAFPQKVKRGNALNTPPSLDQLCVQGHTKSDRAETILFNLIKGTGINGISTLQWKHTFLSACNSNTVCYPISSDFFKEIRIICLQSLFINTDLQKKKVNTNRSSLAIVSAYRYVLQKNLVLLRPLNATRSRYYNTITKTTKNSNQSKSNLFHKNSHLRTFYYQLKYKTKKLL